MQSTSYLVILLEARTATQDLRQPELAYCTLHVADLALGRGRSLDPLGRFSSNTTDHVGVGQGLGGPLLRLHIERGRNWLCDAGVKRRGPARNDQVGIALIAGTGPSIAFAGTRAREGRVRVE